MKATQSTKKNTKTPSSLATIKAEAQAAGKAEGAKMIADAKKAMKKAAPAVTASEVHIRAIAKPKETPAIHKLDKKVKAKKANREHYASFPYPNAPKTPGAKIIISLCRKHNVTRFRLARAAETTPARLLSIIKTETPREETMSWLQGLVEKPSKKFLANIAKEQA